MDSAPHDTGNRTRGREAALSLRWIFALLILLPWAALAAEPNATPDVRALKGKSIEELMEMPVTSVGRKPTRFVEAASAVDVITDDEIRRSGATTFPDILRLATGVQVAQAAGRD